MTDRQMQRAYLTVSEWEKCFLEIVQEYCEVRAEWHRARLEALFQLMPWYDMKGQQQCFWARACDFGLQDKGAL